MAERKPRATKEESLKAKITSNLEQQAKLVAKIEALKAINNAAKKAEKAKEAKAKKAAKAKEEKELLRAISKSGLSMEAVKGKLGI